MVLLILEASLLLLFSDSLFWDLLAILSSFLVLPQQLPLWKSSGAGFLVPQLHTPSSHHLWSCMWLNVWCWGWEKYPSLGWFQWRPTVKLLEQGLGHHHQGVALPGWRISVRYSLLSCATLLSPSFLHCLAPLPTFHPHLADASHTLLRMESKGVSNELCHSSLVHGALSVFFHWPLNF